MTTAAKQERANIRLTTAQKALIERAAALDGCTVTEFFLRAAEAAAEQTVQRHMIRVSAQESQLLMDALLHPEAPSEAAVALMREYYDFVRGDHPLQVRTTDTSTQA